MKNLAINTSSAHTEIKVTAPDGAEAYVQTYKFIEWLCETQRDETGAPVYLHDFTRKMIAYVALGKPHHIEVYDYQQFFDLPSALGGLTETELQDLLKSYLLSTGKAVMSKSYAA